MTELVKLIYQKIARLHPQQRALYVPLPPEYFALQALDDNPYGKIGSISETLLRFYGGQFETPLAQNKLLDWFTSPSREKVYGLSIKFISGNGVKFILMCKNVVLPFTAASPFKRLEPTTNSHFGFNIIGTDAVALGGCPEICAYRFQWSGGLGVSVKRLIAYRSPPQSFVYLHFDGLPVIRIGQTLLWVERAYIPMAHPGGLLQVKG